MSTKLTKLSALNVTTRQF